MIVPPLEERLQKMLDKLGFIILGDNIQRPIGHKFICMASHYNVEEIKQPSIVIKQLTKTEAKELAESCGVLLHLDYDFYQNVPNFELILGLAWGSYFDCQRYHVSLRAAYEFHEWWDQMNMRRFFSGSTGYANDVVSRGNFTLNGFSFRLQFDM